MKVDIDGYCIPETKKIGSWHYDDTDIVFSIELGNLINFLISSFISRYDYWQSKEGNDG